MAIVTVARFPVHNAKQFATADPALDRSYRSLP